MLQRRRRDLTPITGKAFFNDPKLRLVGEPTPSARGDDFKAAHCPKTVLIPVHKDNATDSLQPLKVAALGYLRRAARDHLGILGIRGVVAVEIGDRLEVGGKSAQQPHRLDIAPACPLQPARRADLVE